MSGLAKKRRAKKIPTKPITSEEMLTQQTNAPDLRCEFLSSPHALADVWEPFLADHSAWLERFRNGPIYLLHETVVTRLAQATPSLTGCPVLISRLLRTPKQFDTSNEVYPTFILSFFLVKFITNCIVESSLCSQHCSFPVRGLGYTLFIAFFG